jgi:hypothetical protein
MLRKHSTNGMKCNEYSIGKPSIVNVVLEIIAMLKCFRAVREVNMRKRDVMKVVRIS